MKLTTKLPDRSRSYELQGLDLNHDLELMADGWPACGNILAHIRRAGGTFVAVRATLISGIVTAKIRFQNLSSDEAQVLADVVAAEGSCRGVRLDHLYLPRRVSSAAAPMRRRRR